MRIQSITLARYIDGPGGETSAHFSVTKGYDLWRDEESGGVWVKRGSKAKLIGPTNILEATPHDDDVPLSPREKAEKDGRRTRHANTAAPLPASSTKPDVA